MSHTDDQIEADVREELSRDSRVDAPEVALRVREGVVVLRGTVGSFAQKWAAQEAAKRVAGVVDVENELQVRPMDMHERADAELRGQILQLLIWNTFVPPSVDATVFGGVVTLRGTAQSAFQREEAEIVARNVEGVRGVRNEITLVRGPAVAEVDDAVARALQRNAGIDAGAIDVEAEDGTVTLRGSVGSWAEHDAAVAAAWSAPGVTAVDDQLSVVPAA
jgi:osmotically-inducible protein OsmY